MKKFNTLLSGLALLALFAASAAQAQTPTPEMPLALHKAIYSFKMKGSQPGSGLNGIGGKMYFEQGATCDAWTTEHRFTTEYQYAEQDPLVDASHYVAYETKDGQQLSFNSEREEDGDDTEQLRGSVQRAADGTGQAIYSRPDDLKYDLPKNYLLPTAHTQEIIRHAKAGDHYFSAVMFDGTDADGPVEIGTFIGKKATPEELKKIAASSDKIDAGLMTPDAWHVRLAVFPLEDREAMTASYEMDLILHENGVVSYALVDYKTFAVEQNLTALEKLPPPKKCD